MVLLDTNICIDLLNQRPGFKAILRRLDGRQQGEVALSAITLAELRFGIAASQRRDVNLAKLELFLAVFEIAPFDASAATAYGSLRARLKALGTPIGCVALVSARRGWTSPDGIRRPRNRTVPRRIEPARRSSTSDPS